MFHNYLKVHGRSSLAPRETKKRKTPSGVGETAANAEHHGSTLCALLIGLTIICCYTIMTPRQTVAADTGPVYPGEEWEVIAQPEDYEFSSEAFAKAQGFSKRLSTSAVVVIYDGKILYEWGQVQNKFITRSIRKSFMSALYGVYVEKGKIDLDKTLSELGIDDIQPLTDIEKGATVRQCLMARSGVYLPSAAESAAMKAVKPKRGSHTPGEFWCYNNWDFNVLGTILKQEIGQGFFEVLKMEIADKIQMENFEIDDGRYQKSDKSIHPAYHFRMTPRDMARFGLLMLRQGQWNGNEIIPANWVNESTTYRSDASLFAVDGYGYMWWVAKEENRFPHLPFVRLPEGSFSARGAYGQYILVIPKYDLVIVHCVDTSEKGNSVSAGGMGLLVRKILEAMHFEEPAMPPTVPTDYAGVFELRPGVELTVSCEDGRLFLQRTGLPREEAFPESLYTFYLAKNSAKITFVRSDEGTINTIVVHQLNRETIAKRVS